MEADRSCHTHSRVLLQMNIFLLRRSRRDSIDRVEWRGAGVVERGGLENRCPFTGTQGSNPCLSATHH